MQHTHKRGSERRESGCSGSIETDADLQYTSTHCVITRDRVSKRETERYAPLFYPKQRLSTAPVLVPLSQALLPLPLGPRSCAHSFNLTNGTDYVIGTKDNCVASCPSDPMRPRLRKSMLNGTTI